MSSDEWSTENDESPRSPNTFYTASRNGPDKFPPGAYATIRVKVPLWQHGALQEFVDNPRWSSIYKHQVAALCRDALMHRMLELQELENDPIILARQAELLRRIRWEEWEADLQANIDHYRGRIEGTERVLRQIDGEEGPETVQDVVDRCRVEAAEWPAGYRKQLEDVLDDYDEYKPMTRKPKPRRKQR